MNPLVSIIMPAKNAGKTIQESIRSVVAQTIADWELIVVDDQSVDDTYNLAINWHRDDARIRVLSFKDNCLGAAGARNHAIGHSQGRYLALLDSDDLWMPEKLALQIGHMRTTNSVLSYTGYRFFRNATGGERQYIKEIRPRETISYSQLLAGNPICCSTVMMLRSALSLAPFPYVERKEDYALWLNLSRSGVKLCGMNNVLTDYRIDANSVSANKFTMAILQWKVYRQFVGLPLHEAVYNFALYAAAGIRKHVF